jgi:hypothetical protein
MKLSIQGLDARTSDKLIQAVLKVCDINEDQYTAIIGYTIETTVDCCSNEGETEHNLNRIALLFPGNNKTETIDAMREYIIVGDGPCPHCGGDNFIERGLTNTCTICGYDWTPEFETSKYYQL